MMRLCAGLLLAASAAALLGRQGFARARSELAPALGTRVACATYAGLPPGWRKQPRAGMVWIEGGNFVPGSSEGYADERPPRPARRVEIDGFWIDRTEVTNAQFTAFVADTHYVTWAEREGASAVFRQPSERELAERPQPWWRREAGADWRHPDGPHSDLRGRASHPVVHIAYEDAQAYARWLGRALPSEDQWEFAARAGRSDELLHGAPVSADATALANFWQGEFPLHNDAADGFPAQAPVGCYPANPYGLHDMIGNVWEWTRDRYQPRVEPLDHAQAGVACDTGSSREARVIKGGSFLCAANFCARYRVAARHPHEATSTTAHLGFRTVLAR